MTTATLAHVETRAAANRAVAVWLFVCCAMIFAMVVIGGVTRLTESGLSIVQWQPLGGAIPPLSAADWQEAFRQYQASPQYLQVNKGMSLTEFQGIFWWEFIHRLWGRLIGLVFLVPFLWFWATGRLNRSMRLPLATLFVLGGVQGAIGWWMVASGLKDVPWVSPYRLTLHLGMAVMIYGIALWMALGLLGIERHRKAGHGARRLSWIVFGLVSCTVLAGGFVAGLDAGQIYNEFPTMGDGLVPPDYRNQALSWLANSFENHAAVQFHHRVLAMTSVAGVILLWLVARSRPLVLNALLAWVFVQAGLGIATLLAHVPVHLGAAHQAGALILFTLALVAARQVGSRVG